MFLLSGSSFICSLWIVSFPRMISERETKGRKADECFSWEYARYSDSRRPNQTGMTSHLKKKKKKGLLHPSWKLVLCPSSAYWQPLSRHVTMLFWIVKEIIWKCWPSQLKSLYDFTAGSCDRFSSEYGFFL